MQFFLVNLDTFSIAHQCHNVIGQVSSQIRGDKTREASEGNTRVILVGTAEILRKKKIKRGKFYETEKAGREMNNSL